jgi:hypothetical protein
MTLWLTYEARHREGIAATGRLGPRGPSGHLPAQLEKIKSGVIIVRRRR